MNEREAGSTTDQQITQDSIRAPSFALTVGNRRHDAIQRRAQQQIAGPVKRCSGSLRSGRRHEKCPHNHGDGDQRQRHEEHVAPAERVDDQAAHQGTETQRKYQTHTVNTHGGTPSFRRKHLDNGHHHQGLNHASGKSLHDPADDDEIQRRRECAEQPARGKYGQNDGKCETLPEGLDKPGIEKLACGHGGDKRRGEKLRQILAHSECAHDIGHRDVGNGAGKHHGKRRRDAGYGR